ncbi:MAG: 3-oxoacyl-ACP reductase FabG [Solirubrobacterales bacterium]
MSETKRLAIVTGASRGIGAATALTLAQSGWHVAVNYRTNAEAAERVVAAIRFSGGSAVAAQADVTDSSEVGEMLDKLAEHGPVAALVNNAGITADGLSMTLSDQDWDRVVETNLTAAFRLTRQVLPGMIRARYGRIVNVASVIGPKANPGQANYAAAKAGLIGFTRTVAVEVARKNITVNAVLPGFIASDMTSDIPSDAAQAIPIRRLGAPDEVADAIEFLTSDSSKYITGTQLVVDGGLSA